MKKFDFCLIEKQGQTVHRSKTIDNIEKQILRKIDNQTERQADRLAE